MPANMLALGCLLLFPALASAHGLVTQPVGRGLRVATNASAGGGLAFAGECPGEGTACTWYSQKVTIPGKATNCDPNMRTMGVSCGDENPIDFPCAGGVPWCAPGTAPVRSPCGIFSGGWNSRGRDQRDLDSSPMATWK